MCAAGGVRAGDLSSQRPSSWSLANTEPGAGDMDDAYDEVEKRGARVLGVGCGNGTDC